MSNSEREESSDEKEAPLQRKVPRIQSVANHLSEGIFRSTSEGGFVFANQAFAEIFGYPCVEEVLQVKPTALYAKPDREERLRKRAYEQGGVDDVEVLFRRKDGSTFPGLLSGTVIREDDGERFWYDGVVTDMTEEREQEETLRRHRNLLEQTQRLTGAWEVDLQANEVTWTEEVYRIHELPPGTEVDVEEAIQFYAPEARSTLREAFQRCIEEKEPYDLELPLITAEATHRWVRTVGAPVEVEEGEVVKVAGAFQDITERKNAEQALREREAQLRGLANSIPGVIFRFYARPDGEYGNYFVSDRAEDVLGISSDPEDFFERFVERVPSSFRETLIQSVDEVVEQKETWRLEVPFEKPSGEKIWILGTATPEAREDELLFNGVLLDITEQKEYQEDLERTTNLLRLSEEMVDIGGWSVDVSGTEPYNTEWTDKLYDLFELPREQDPPTEEVFEYYHPEDRERHREVVLQATETGEGWDQEIRLITAEGNERWVRNIGEPVVEDGEVVKIRGAIQDITQRRSRRRELEQADTLFENAQDALFLIDVDREEDEKTFTVQRVNPAFEEATGLSGEAIIGERPPGFLTEEPGRQESRYRECVRRREPLEYEEEVRLEGTTTYWNTRLAPVIIDGEVEQIVGTTRDVTEQKERKRELEITTRRLEAILEHTTRPMFMKDRDGEYLLTNRCFRELFGLEGDEALGKTDEDLFSSEITQTLQEHDQHVLVQGTPVEFEEEIQIEGDLRVYLTSKVPLYDVGTASDPDTPVALFGVATDITERKRVEEELRSTTNFYEQVLNQAPIDLAVFRPDATYEYLNPENVGDAEMREWLYGRNNEAYCRKRGLDLEIGRRRDEAIRRAARQKETTQLEETLETSEGPRHFLRVHSPVTNLEGEVTHVVAFGLDITEQKEHERKLREAKEEAEEASQMKSVFLANMSHEIRTPLTSILGFAEAIGESIQEEQGRVPRFVRLIEQSGRRLLETLDGVLNLSKLEAGDMELAADPIDLEEEAEQMADELRSQAEEEGLDLEVEASEEATWARADAGGIQIVLRNLVSNAIKYTEAGGQIWIRIRDEDDAAVLEVEDTGIGMSEAEVPDLFEAFRQESEGMGREYEGTGLGLTVTRRAVEKMGGTIRVDTEKGEGSCFTVRLPRADG